VSMEYLLTRSFDTCLRKFVSFDTLVRTSGSSKPRSQRPRCAFTMRNWCACVCARASVCVFASCMCFYVRPFVCPCLYPCVRACMRSLRVCVCVCVCVCPCVWYLCFCIRAPYPTPCPPPHSPPNPLSPQPTLPPPPRRTERCAS